MCLRPDSVAPAYCLPQVSSIEAVDEASRRAAIARLRESPWVRASKSILSAPDLSTPGVVAVAAGSPDADTRAGPRARTVLRQPTDYACVRAASALSHTHTAAAAVPPSASALLGPRVGLDPARPRSGRLARSSDAVSVGGVAPTVVP